MSVRSTAAIGSGAVHGLAIVGLLAAASTPRGGAVPSPPELVEVTWIDPATLRGSVDAAPEPPPVPPPEPEPLADPEPAPAPVRRAEPPIASPPDVRPPPRRGPSRALEAPVTNPDAAAPSRPRRLAMLLTNDPRADVGASDPASRPGAGRDGGGGGTSVTERRAATGGGPSARGDARCDAAPTRPTIRSKVPIEYPEAARREGLEGRLVLRASVDEEGVVTEVEVVQGVDPRLDEPAVATLRAWTFEPATRCGRPIAGGFTLAREFRLGD